MPAQALGQLRLHHGLRSAMCCRLHHRWRRRQRGLGPSRPQLAAYTQQARSQLTSNRHRCPRRPTHPLLASLRCRRTSSQQQGRSTCLRPHHCSSAAAAAARSPAPAGQPHPATRAVWGPDLAACCTWEGQSPPPAAPPSPHSRRQRRRRRRLPQLLLTSRLGTQVQGSQTGVCSHLWLPQPCQACPPMVLPAAHEWRWKKRQVPSKPLSRQPWRPSQAPSRQQQRRQHRRLLQRRKHGRRSL